MVGSVVTVEQAATPRAALQAIIENRFHCVPVIENECLVGMITGSDCLRELTYGEWSVYSHPVDRHMHRPAELVAAETSLVDVCKRVAGNRGYYLVVVQNGLPIGVISEKECRRAQLTAAGYFTENAGYVSYGPPVSIGDLFAGQPLVLNPGQTLGEATSEMLNRGVRAVAVADASGTPMGVLREDDILWAMVEELS